MSPSSCLVPAPFLKTPGWRSGTEVLSRSISGELKKPLCVYALLLDFLFVINLQSRFYSRHLVINPSSPSLLQLLFLPVSCLAIRSLGLMFCKCSFHTKNLSSSFACNRASCILTWTPFWRCKTLDNCSYNSPASHWNWQYNEKAIVLSLLYVML